MPFRIGTDLWANLITQVVCQHSDVHALATNTGPPRFARIFTFEPHDTYYSLAISHKMAEPMTELSPEKLNAPSSTYPEDDIDMTSWHDPPSSPFISNIDNENQENVAPDASATPNKLLPSFDDDMPQSAFKVSPEKKFGLKDRTSPLKMSPKKQSLGEYEEDFLGSPASHAASRNTSPTKHMERSGSAMSSRSHKNSPIKTSRNASTDSVHQTPSMHPEDDLHAAAPTPAKRHQESDLRDNEGLTVAMRNMEQATFHKSHDDIVGDATFDDTEFNPDGPELTSVDADDTNFSMFSEMPGIDMTKFAALRQSPTRSGLVDPVSIPQSSYEERP